MNLVKYVVPVLGLLMLNGCAGAHISIPVGPVTIGTDISMFGDSGRDRNYNHVDEEASDELMHDESDHQDERE
ncbi:MAG: hypothetical protein ABUK11_02310 [Mariprofundaceae bacterium]